MRGQSHRSFCGPATVANVLRALGLSTTVTEDDVAKKIRLRADLRETDPSDGTSEGQILKALAAYRLRGEQVTLHQGHAAVCALRGHLAVGRPVVLCVDGNQHWVGAIGVLGERFLVADPADPEVVVSVTGEALAERWKYPGHPPQWNAIAVHPRTRGRSTK